MQAEVLLLNGSAVLRCRECGATQLDRALFVRKENGAIKCEWCVGAFYDQIVSYGEEADLDMGTEYMKEWEVVPDA